MNKVETIPAGKTLYHGTSSKFYTGFPVGKDGIWFATNPIQSILHVAVKSGGLNGKRPMYFYIYKTIKPLKVIKFDSSQNMNNWAVRSGFPAPPPTYAFSNKDYELAKYLCKEGVYDGWWFPNDQSQVMLCKPSELLKFVKVMEISFPYGRPNRINFTKVNNKGQYVVDEAGRKYKYKLVNTTLNNLYNYRAPPKNAVYSLRKTGTSSAVYYNHTGKRISLTNNMIRSPNGFNINGKRYYAGSFSSMYGNQEITMRNRIMAATGEPITKTSHDMMKITILNPNQKAKMEEKLKRINEFRSLYQKYIIEMRRRNALGLPVNNLVEPLYPQNAWPGANNRVKILPLPEPRKSMNNININASSLFNGPKHRRKSTPVRYGQKR
jgi:hypothetical protein